MTTLTTRFVACLAGTLVALAGCTPAAGGHGGDAGDGLDAGPAAATCSDGITNGTETDTDCGGTTCRGCAVGEKCAVTSDCLSDEGCDTATKMCDANQCHDGVQNGGETDIDCGGGVCPACVVGDKCRANADCTEGEGCDVTTKKCDANLCHDGIEDGAETDVDCGGGVCPACVVGERCNSDSDCATGAGCDVTTGKCDSNQCHDGVQNGAETAIDCGGGTCPGCPVGQACKSTSDCLSGEGCDIKTGICDSNTCNDGAQDGSETDIDCGGTCPGCGVGAKCSATSDCAAGEGCDTKTKMCDGNTCNDGAQDGPETDVDCGGTCPGCGVGAKCSVTSDCAAGEGCDAKTKTCDATTCHDGAQDGPETDVDCGGTCSGCLVGEKCISDGDCVAGAGCDVTTKKCDATQCHDGVQDGAETDIDCGGGVCPACVVGRKCSVTSDCAAGEGCDVTTKECDATTCHDGLQDGPETGVDCGGTCPGCAVGITCNATSDCASGEGCDVTSKTCDATTCNDGVADGPETGVDCGGTCPGCLVGGKCSATSDCASGEGCDVTTKACDANTCNDGAHDGPETGVDCGGGCPGCPVGDPCKVTSDCASGEGCDKTAKTCDATTCNDGVQDGPETDVDCGGTCSACAVGQKCNATSDCVVGGGCDAKTKTCDATTCNDGVADGTETDVDCGGTCPGCLVGGKCTSDGDCVAGAGCDVTTKRCDSNQCHDGFQNGEETDVDCGGDVCPRCAIDGKCSVTSDCQSGDGCDVTTKECEATTCHDGVQDFSETDVDCGGHCPSCGVGQKCNGTSDCASGEGCDVTSKTCDATTCNDGVADGPETDVDCGGTCPVCAYGQKCSTNSDCAIDTGCDVTTKTCDLNSCHDGIQDVLETDVDCGGNCPGCGVGQKCGRDPDCASFACDGITLTCDASECSDHRMDGLETDVDCGGPCSECVVGKKCRVDTDCTTNACDAIALICVPGQCSDNRPDGTETDVDCGGNCPAACAIGKKCLVNSDCTPNACDAVTLTCTSQCSDQRQDGTETDADCGGACSGCATGRNCLVDGDCTSNACDGLSLICDANQCSDRRQDGTETDVDCGGSCSGKCASGKKCSVDTDCSSSACDGVTLICDATQCSDRRQDGTETDVDCGGFICAKCAIGKKCSVATDCTTSACDPVTGTCASSTCTDQQKDGTETDVDCGGGTCPTCATGKKCSVASDCTTVACDLVTGTCATSTCTDQQKDGAETDVDCGGGTCPGCGVALKCKADSDCAGNACDAELLECTINQCLDHRQDGAETDIDCGGGVCPVCLIGQKCLANTDCPSGHVCNASKVCQ